LSKGTNLAIKTGFCQEAKINKKKDKSFCLKDKSLTNEMVGRELGH